MNTNVETTTSVSGYRVQNPATGELLKNYPYPSQSEIEQTLSRADKAFNEWKTLSVRERAEAVQRAGELFKSRVEELGEIITREMGKGLSESQAEIDLCKGIFDYYVEQAEVLTADQTISVPAGNEAIVEKLPIGVVLGIMPWNFPYYQLLRLVVPNLILGNTIIIKPAETCPESALAIQQIFEDAGLPAGAYNTVLATHEQIEQLVNDSRVRGVSVTGSERAGVAIGINAARNLKKTVLELGGSDAYVVLDAEDAAAAARTAWTTRVSNMGQSCNSNKRIIAMDSVYDELVSEMVSLASDLKPGDPNAELPGTFNPMASARGAAELEAQIRDAVEKGATLHVGGNIVEAGSAYFVPAVLTGVTKEMRAYSEELFGPVAVIYRVESDEEAVTLANDSEFGLGGAVFSSDIDRATKVARQLESGMTHVNVPAAFGAQLPFGGVKRSGIGRELGPEGMDEFANKRLLYVAR
ncbi:MAG: NAD-dependent succinate-semialdehyde dehydrogenase [Gulosibacter sp.]|uniref:NAD-dependent succinate-semialdehyde dehydrogenase n=1 Tax=Gulosibacter sp. TaxID=2817531 RepID=UPI003F91BB81